MGFAPNEAGAIGIIGGADGPTTIFITARLAPHLLPAVAVAAYGYMALVPIIQPPIVRALTTKQERLIKMPAPREVSKVERIAFPVVAFVLCTMFAPKATTLLGMLFFGNLLKESGVTDRLANTAKTAFIDSVTILLGICVGAGATAERFLTQESLQIFALGLIAFSVATASGVLFAKLMNRLSRQPLNPILGAAGVSAVPMAARVAMITAQRDDPSNFLIMHAMAPNVAGVIGSAVAAGVLLALLGG
jgi:oxaloacetate decarboxylase beta subunit